MHPYSEYIHKYMLDKNKLNSIGKIKDDIRVPRWGRFLRRFWIDELPMLLNFLQGDLKLVGVRPVSESFLKLYPDDLKRERLKTEPGLIPAVYADMPYSIEGVWESERKYLMKYKVSPLRTDIIYFTKIVMNVLFRGIRSS